MAKHRLSLILLSCAAALSAQEPEGIYMPGAEVLDDAGKALLQEGNEDLKKSYHAILDQHDPVEAERLMNRVIIITAMLGGEIGTIEPGSFKVGIYGHAKKNRNIVEMSGGLDVFGEMEMRSLTTVIDYDFKVHRRKILANFAVKAKDVKALQKFIVDELYDRGNVKSRTGAQNSGPQDPELAKLAKKFAKNEPEGPEDNDPKRMAVSPSAAQPQDPAGDEKAGPQSENALKDAPGQQAQPQAAAQKAPDGTDAKADAKAGPKTDDANAPKSPDASKSLSLPQQAGATSGSPTGNGPNARSDEDLAQKQDEVAQKLDDMAQKSLAQGADAASKAITDAFRKAADFARNAAAAIRRGDRTAAAAAAASAQRAADQAFAAAQGNSEQLRQEQTAALESAVSSIQERQAQVVADAKHLADATAAGTLSAAQIRQQGSQLAQTQGGLKEDISSLEKGIDELASSLSPSSADKNEQAVLEHLRNASTALHEGRAQQEAVNATINLDQGHISAALSAIARENAALDQAHARIAAAADADAGGHGSDRQALSELQRLSASLRRLGQNTLAAQEGAKLEAQAHADGKTDATTPAPAAASQPLPAELGNVLDATAAELAAQVEQAVSQLPQASEEQKKRITSLARQKVPIAKDPGAGLQHLSDLVAEVEGLEADLSHRIEQDHQHAALETFLKDPVPAAYRASVADYYQLLADDLAAAPPPAASDSKPSGTNP